MMPIAMNTIRAQIDECLREVIDDTMLHGPHHDHPLIAKVYAWMQHYLWNAGGRMHGLCVALAAQACGANRRDIIPVAAAFQLYHHHTLIHDDVYDQDQSRRGWPTAHRAFARLFHDDAERRGAIIAFAYGKICRALAYKLLTHSSFRADAILDVVRAWDRHDVTDNVAQILDIAHEHDEQLSSEACLANAYAKTGRLFELCAYVGPRLVNAEIAQRDALEYWAGRSGLAYQVQDDLEDISLLSEKGQGRGIGSDLLLGKATYLYAIAREQANPSQRIVLDRWQTGVRAGLELGDIIAILEATEAQKRAQEKIRALVTEIGERLRENFAEHICVQLLEFTEYFLSGSYWRRVILPDAGQANELLGLTA